jgi:hypothetical protein
MSDKGGSRPFRSRRASRTSRLSQLSFEDSKGFFVLTGFGRKFYPGLCKPLLGRKSADRAKSLEKGCQGLSEVTERGAAGKQAVEWHPKSWPSAEAFFANGLGIQNSPPGKPSLWAAGSSATK